MSRQFKVTVNGREYDVAVLEVTPGSAPIAQTTPGYAVDVSPGMAAPVVPAPARGAAQAATAPAQAAGDEVAQMGGVVVQVDVKVGQVVAAGDRLLVLEAMKMKTHLMASRAGQVTRVLVAAGDAVEGGQPLITLQ
jgi:biotin carboxyl carrier protein